MTDNSFNADSEFLQGFVADSQELLDQAEPCLIELQESCEASGSVNGETLNSIFRLFHSLKGSSDFLRLENVKNVTHDPELQLTITPEMITHFVQESDELLQTIEQTLLDIEKSSDKADLPATAFRGIHSFKGNCGKKVRLIKAGEETEVDKTVIEQIADPLVHIIRNAIDHGIDIRSRPLSKGCQTTTLKVPGESPACTILKLTYERGD